MMVDDFIDHSPIPYFAPVSCWILHMLDSFDKQHIICWIAFGNHMMVINYSVFGHPASLS